jgi:type I restriction enzyme, S subunit
VREMGIRLKYVCRLAYGDALRPEQDATGSIEVFGSNGQYAFTERANTLGPAIIVGRKGSYGKVNWSSHPCFASDTTFFIDSTQTSHDLRWLFWTLQTIGIDEGSHETAIPGVNRETIYEKRVFVPPIDMQRRIAHVLDAETAQLDALVAEKEQMLALLEEKRTALVSRMVIRGLNPDVRMKPSGLDWLGDIPAHWKVQRCATLFTEVDERNEPDLPLLNVSINTGVTLRTFSDDRIESVAEDFTTYKVARKGQLVFNKMRFWQGAAGIAPVDGLTSPDYTVAHISQALVPAFVGLLFRLPQFSDEVRRYSYGMVDDRLRLYWDEFKNIRIPLPPINEQNAIVTVLTQACSHTAELEATLHRSIALLKERRSALITAAVTGQLTPEAISA